MGKTTISSPTPPAAPTTAESIQAWVNAMPAIFAEQQRQAPLEAQQQVDLAQQFAAPLGQAMLSAQSAMFPQTTALQEKLATTASQGMDSGLPDWAKETYRSNFRAQLGDNALSGSGADYMSRGMMNEEKNWRDYYTNLGLSVASKQPLSQPMQPQYSNYVNQFTPNSVMSFNAGNYGNFSNAYSNMYSANQRALASSNDMWSNIISSSIGAAGTMLAPKK